MKPAKPLERDLGPIVSAWMDLGSLAARMRKDEQVAEWERLEREDEARPGFVPSFASRWHGEFCRGVVRATETPSEAESAACLAYEREQLGIDRRNGTLRKLG